MNQRQHFRLRRPLNALFAAKSEQRLSEQRVSEWNQWLLIRIPVMITVAALLVLQMRVEGVVIGLIVLNIPLTFALSLIIPLIARTHLRGQQWDLIHLAPRAPSLVIDTSVSLAEASVWPWMLLEAGWRITVALLLIALAYFHLTLGPNIPRIFNVLHPGFWIISGLVYFLASILVVEPFYRMRVLIVIGLSVARFGWGALSMVLQAIALVLFANFPYWFLLAILLENERIILIVWMLLSPFYLFSFAFLPTFYQRLQTRLENRLAQRLH